MKRDVVIAGADLDVDEKQIIKFLEKEPRKITAIRDELDIDPGTTYKKIADLEKRGFVKIGYVREKRFRGETFCFLPSQEEDVKARNHKSIFLPVPKTGAEPKPPKPTVNTGLLQNVIEEVNNALAEGNLVGCIYWITELRHLCYSGRVGDIKKLREAVPKWVGDERLLGNVEAREDLALLMRVVLMNEIEGNEIVVGNVVAEAWYEPALKIMLLDRKKGRTYAIQFFQNTSMQNSVHALITLIKKNPEDIRGATEDEVHFALFGSRLSKIQIMTIQKELLKLRSSEDLHVRSVVKHLQGRSRRYAP